MEQSGDGAAYNEDVKGLNGTLRHLSLILEVREA